MSSTLTIDGTLSCTGLRQATSPAVSSRVQQPHPLQKTTVSHSVPSILRMLPEPWRECYSPGNPLRAEQATVTSFPHFDEL